MYILHLHCLIPFLRWCVNRGKVEGVLGLQVKRTCPQKAKRAKKKEEKEKKGKKRERTLTSAGLWAGTAWRGVAWHRHRRHTRALHVGRREHDFPTRASGSAPNLLD
jgi:hypothetical protein